MDVETCTDGSPCYDVGYIDTGEWLAFDVNVTTSKSYAFTARVATTYSGQTFHVTIDGTNVSGAVIVPVTGGWDAWATTASKSLNLTAGRHTLKLVADTPNFNWNWVSFK